MSLSPAEQEILAAKIDFAKELLPQIQCIVEDNFNIDDITKTTQQDIDDLSQFNELMKQGLYIYT